MALKSMPGLDRNLSDSVTRSGITFKPEQGGSQEDGPHPEHEILEPRLRTHSPVTGPVTPRRSHSLQERGPSILYGSGDSSPEIAKVRHFPVTKHQQNTTGGAPSINHHHETSVLRTTSISTDPMSAVKEELQAQDIQALKLQMNTLQERLEQVQLERDQLRQDKGHRTRSLHRHTLFIRDSSSEQENLKLGNTNLPFRRPDPFRGDEGESWSAWRTNFVRKLNFANISDDFERAALFSDSLGGIALRFYNNNLSLHEQSSWEFCSKKFGDRFGTTTENLVGRQELHNMQLQKNESARAFCQRFLEAWSKAYPKTKADTSSTETYILDKFIAAIGDEQAILYVGCAECHSLEEVCIALQRWLDANSLAEVNKRANLGTKQKNRTNNFDIPVYNTGDPDKGKPNWRKEMLDLSVQIQELKREFLASKTNSTSKSRSKKPKNSNIGRVITRIPQWAKVFKLKKDPKVGECWFCGEQTTEHTVRNCPVRLKMEENHPGSTMMKSSSDNSLVLNQENC